MVGAVAVGVALLFLGSGGGATFSYQPWIADCLYLIGFVLLAKCIIWEWTKKQARSARRRTVRIVSLVMLAVGSVVIAGNHRLYWIHERQSILAKEKPLAAPPNLRVTVTTPPEVSICISHGQTSGGRQQTTILKLKSDVKITKPWYTFFFDGPILHGLVDIQANKFGYTAGRDDKFPNPERTLRIQLTSVDDRTDWEPGEEIVVTVLSTHRVRLVRISSGSGSDEINEGFSFPCDKDFLVLDYRQARRFTVKRTTFTSALAYGCWSLRPACRSKGGHPVHWFG